jgi:hypothetical protein
MAEFDEFISGKMELNVGGKELLLDVQIKDKRKLKTAFVDGKGLDEKKLEIMDNAFLDILYRSYPAEKKEGIEGFYMKNDVEFMEKFLIKVGWAKQEDLKKVKTDSPN